MQLFIWNESYCDKYKTINKHLMQWTPTKVQWQQWQQQETPDYYIIQGYNIKQMPKLFVWNSTFLQQWQQQTPHIMRDHNINWWHIIKLITTTTTIMTMTQQQQQQWQQQTCDTIEVTTLSKFFFVIKLITTSTKQ